MDHQFGTQAANEPIEFPLQWNGRNAAEHKSDDEQAGQNPDSTPQRFDSRQVHLRAFKLSIQ
jgi:hypothetical protein